MKRLTRVEKLDILHPGLADQVRAWFARGIPAYKVPELLLAQYEVSLTRGEADSFRRQRWVPERMVLEEKNVKALAALEFARAQEMRASTEDPIPGDRK